MAFAFIVVFLMGTATGIEVSAQYPEVPAAVNDFQGTTPHEEAE